MAGNRFAPPVVTDPATSRGLQGLADSLDASAAPPNYAPRTDALVAVPAGAFQPVSPRSGGQDVVIPTAIGSNVGRTVTLFIVNALGTCRVRPVSGTIDGLSATTLPAGITTVLELTSDGAGNWASVLGGQNWAAVLARGATSGANNPIVSVGQFMQFGLVGPTTSNPQIRSGDAVFRVRGTSAVSIGAGTTVSVFSAGDAQLASDAGNVRFDGFTSVIVTTGALVPRLVITSAGEWTTPTGGALGKYLRHAGPGAPPTWATVDIGELATIAANTIVANATGFAAVPTAVAVGTNTVVGRVAGNIVAAQLVAAQVANNTITSAQQAQPAANTIRGNPTAGAANIADISMGTSTILARLAAGNIVAASVAQILTLLGAFSVQNVQVFTATGANTYNPTSGMKSCLVLSTGAGGGGGGTDVAAAASRPAAGGGGGAGGTCLELFSAATIGASQTVTIGVGGTAGSNTGGAGGAGGNTTFGALHTATGGAAGSGSGAVAATVAAAAGGGGGVPTGGLLNINGGAGSDGWGLCCDGTTDIMLAFGGGGGVSFWGGAGRQQITIAAGLASIASGAGAAGSAFGSGGGGAFNQNDINGAVGGIGANGVCVVIEFA